MTLGYDLRKVAEGICYIEQKQKTKSFFFVTVSAEGFQIGFYQVGEN